MNAGEWRGGGEDEEEEVAFREELRNPTLFNLHHN